MTKNSAATRTLYRGFPNPGPWTHITAELARTGRKRALAVVGYVGKDAPTIMPLHDGDVLVCDASEAAIRQGLTSAAALSVYSRRRVSIFSVQGLHAKVVVLSRSAWVGSANASKHSRDELVEASVRVTGEQVVRIRGWADSLATEENALNRSDVARLAKIPVRKSPHGPSQPQLPVEMPKKPSWVLFVETELDRTRKGQVVYDRDINAAKADAKHQGFPTSLQFVRWPASSSRLFHVGEWVIIIREGRVSRPAVVVRAVRRGADWAVWLSEVKTLRRPKYSDLRKVVPELVPWFGTSEVQDQRLLSRIRKLFY